MGRLFDASLNGETQMTSVLHDPKNTFVIENVWVFVSRDEEGNEGVIAAPVGDTLMPFVAADPKRIESLRPMAQHLAKMTKKKIHLVKFSQRTEIEEIK